MGAKASGELGAAVSGGRSLGERVRQRSMQYGQYDRERREKALRIRMIRLQICTVARR